MDPLYDAARHEPLEPIAWDEPKARDTIAAIAGDAERAFDPDRLWPVHPADREPGDPEIMHGVYLGAAGIVHALSRLADAGLHEPALDYGAIADRLTDAPPDDSSEDGSLLAGATGALLVAHRLAPSTATADALAALIAANIDHPANELLYGAPGTMVAARTMNARTGDPRFADLWRASARTLLDRQDDQGLWTQDLGGPPERYVGAGHGFAGNVHVLLAAPEWLDHPGVVEERAVRTARALAIRDGDVATWPPLPEGSRSGAPPRVQWCHGSPGMVIALASLAPADDEHGALMAAGGELTWRAGPIARNLGLCHGTAGNGFAFLALHARTSDDRWLDRARAFAMHALAQTEGLDTRHSLFTGDLGAAMLAAACLTADPAFPGLDDL
jgi:hypothetical protein